MKMAGSNLVSPKRKEREPSLSNRIQKSECPFINLYYKIQLLFSPEYYYTLPLLENQPGRTNYEYDISWFNGLVTSDWIASCICFHKS